MNQQVLERFELSPQQAHIWRLSSCNTDPAFHTLQIILIEGTLHFQRCFSAITRTVARLDILNAAFQGDGSQGFQVAQSLSPKMAVLDWRGLDRGRQQALLDRLVSEPVPIGSEHGPPHWFHLVSLAPAKHLLAISVPALVSDLKGLENLSALIGECYAAGEWDESQSEIYQYHELAQWQNGLLAAPESEAGRAFWSQIDGRALSRMALPFELGEDRGFRPSSFALPSVNALRASIEAFLSKNQAKPAVFFATCWQVLLWRLAPHRETFLGFAGACRTDESFENAVGLFEKYLPLRLSLRPNETFAEAVARVAEAVEDALDWQECFSWETVSQADSLPGKVAFCPFCFSFGSKAGPASYAGLAFSVLRQRAFTDRFKLRLSCLDLGEGWQLELDYDADRYEPESVRLMGLRLTALIESLLDDPARELASHEILGPVEREMVLLTFNRTRAPFQREKCLHQLVEYQVASGPDRVAVIAGNRHLSYGCFNGRANRLAGSLFGDGVRGDTRVGLCTSRSEDMAVGVMGILKAGGAYVPLDPAYPTDRLAYLMEDASLEYLVANERAANALPSFQLNFLTVRYLEEIPRIAPEREEPGTGISVLPQNLAYLIYTSGTSGRPKGVLLHHRGWCNLVAMQAQGFAITPESRVLQFASLNFDASASEIGVTLASGATLCMVSQEERLPGPSLIALLMRQRVSHITLPPTALSVLPADELPYLTCVVSAGETCAPDLIEAWSRGRLFRNAYGPTETTVCASISDCDSLAAKSSIGPPARNTTIYIADPTLRPTPIQIRGEILIGGTGLARGYWRRPRLTAQRFIANPFADLPGERLYKTGDLGSYLPNGFIVFHGRADRQVKVRGYRIELGEIEARLMEHPEVREAAVTVRQDDPETKRLVAYVVPGDMEAQPDRDALRDFLKERLPDYMIPAAVTCLPEFPLNNSGKVDRAALPDPDEYRRRTQNYAAPETEVEKNLAEVWAQLLKLERIGVHENVFAVGADSIIGIQACSRLKQFGYQLLPHQIFDAPTIAEMAKVATAATPLEIEQGAVTGESALTPIQAWFFERYERDRHHYNQSFLFQTGKTLSLDLLTRAVEALLEHHDALRSRFAMRDGAPRQVYAPIDARTLGRCVIGIDRSALEGAARDAAIADDATRFQKSLDLENGPLFRLVRFDLGPETEARILILAHHLVIDNVSWNIILEDLTTAFDQLERNEAVRLPPKTTSFKEWSQCLHELAASDRLAGELDFWTRSGQKPIGSLPLDMPENADENTILTTESLTLSLEREETLALLREAPAAYRTEINDILLTALGLTLAEWTGSDHFAVSMEGHGREGLLGQVDLSRTVGWFTGLFPVYLALPESRELAACLKSVKEQLRAIPRRGIGYGMLRYASPDPAVTEFLAAQPHPQIGFNYQGQIDQMLQEAQSFQPARESAGQKLSGRHRRPTLWDIGGQIVGDRLYLSLAYGNKIHRRETVTAFLEQYLQSIRRIVAHCTTPGVGSPTPWDVPDADLDQNRLDGLMEALPRGIRPRDIKDIYTLSPLQQGMLYHSFSEPESGVYVVQTACELRGPLETAAFRTAWDTLVQRHDILRTFFIGLDTQKPLQVVLKRAAMAWHEEDCRHMEEKELRAKIDALWQHDRKLGFDLSRAPLSRVSLIRKGEDRYTFFWTHHHAIMDGWSRPRLVNDVLAVYQAKRNRRAANLPDAPSYRDYIRWLREHGKTEAESFWRDYLKGFGTPTAIPADHPESPGAIPVTARRRMVVEEEVTGKLSDLVRGEEITMYVLVQSVWGLLLGHYGGEPDVVFGTVVSGRPPDLQNVEEIVGPFINTIPARVDVRPGERVKPWLRRHHKRKMACTRHEHSPLKDIQRWSEVSGPLFHCLMGFENFPMGEALEERDDDKALDLFIEAIDVMDQTNYPLTITLSADTRMVVDLTYDTQRFRTETVARLHAGFRTILERIAADADLEVLALPYLPESERHRIVVELNDTRSPLPRMQLLAQWFEAQAAKSPQSIAAVYERENGIPDHLDFQSLEARANRLAHRLRGLGVGPEVAVALYLHRSPNMLAGLLGILKAGGCYVPLDPTYPLDRLAYMIEDAGGAALLSEEDAAVTFTGLSLPMLRLDRDRAVLDRQAGTPPDPRLRPENTAYVIYTSGSTGAPKGVRIPHRAILNRLLWMQAAYPLSTRDKLLQKTAIGFDAAGWEIYLPLFFGAQMVLAPAHAQQDPALLVGLLIRHRITRLQVVPTLLRALLDVANLEEARSLTHLFSGGEVLAADLAKRLKTRLDTVLVNLYGPTECSIDASFLECGADVAGPVVPIGRPLSNVQTHVLDRWGRWVPPGVTGELHLGGTGLARGYLGRPGLTAEKFVPNAFLSTTELPGSAIGTRLYRSGDRVRRLPDGTLDYLGRLDAQVKLRGFRIEPGEIENVLMRHPALRDARVLAREDRNGRQVLVAYTVRHKLDTLPNGMEIASFNKNETQVLFREIFEERCYLKHGIGIEDGDLIFDVGANIGMFSLFVHCLNKRDVRIFAFEPLPPTLEKLRTNLALHRVGARTFDCGLSREPASREAAFYPHWTAMSGVYADAGEEALTRAALQNRGGLLAEHADEVMEGRFEKQSFTCRFSTVSEIVREHEVPRIDLLKIDVEKSELDVLAGIEEADWPKIKQMAIEVHDLDGRLARITELLEGKGFRVVAEEDPTFAGSGLYNLYAVHPSHRRQTGAASPTDPEELPDRKAEPLPSGSVDLKAFLKQSLPEYMVPAWIVDLEAMPLLPSGKVDVKSLPSPDEAQTPAIDRSSKPRNPTEETLAEIWSRILGLEEVGIHDNFFDLGGDSILNIQIVGAALRRGLKLSPFLLFNNPTIAQLAAAVEVTGARPAERKPVLGSVPLTPVQHWFFEHATNPNHWNWGIFLKTDERFSFPAVREAVAYLMQHHDSLRSRFTQTDRGWEQRIAESPDPAFEIFHKVDVSNVAEPDESEELERAAECIQGSLDIARGGLMRVVWFDFGAHRPGRLLFLVHHLVLDFFSEQILMEDFATLYRQITGGMPKKLPEKTTAYQEWAKKLVPYAKSESLMREFPYWKRIGEQTFKTLPTEPGFDSQKQRIEDIRTHSFALDSESTAALLNEVPSVYQTDMFEFLLTVMALTIGEWIGENKIMLTLYRHGREELFEGMDLSRTVGWFTALYPQLLDLRSAKDPGAALVLAKRQIRETPGRGRNFNILRYLSPDPEVRETLRKVPEPEVSFNYHGQVTQAVQRAQIFELAPESRGSDLGRDQRAPVLLNLSGSIAGDRLSLVWLYHGKAFRVETVQNLSGRFLERTKALIAHCRSVERDKTENP